MIPILYESSEKNFTSNGLGRLRDCSRVEVTEERNGLFEVEFDYPVDGMHFDDIIPGRIIAVTHDETGDVQPFDIYYSSKPINGLVTFRAQHISYRLAKMTVRGGAGATGITAALNLLRSTTPANPFSFETDISNSTSYFSATATVPITARSAIGGTEGSILDTFGGELEWDKWAVRLWQRRGTNKALTIRYGTNLVDYTDETDFSETYSQVLPYWSGNVNGKDIVVRGSITSSGKKMYDGRTACIPLDLSQKFENRPTTAQLNSAAASYLKSNSPTLPARTISVDFVRLADTVEYEQFAPLQKCGLCDTVEVVFPRYEMNGSFKIVQTVYDVLQERYLSLELGDLSMTLSEALGISESSTNSANLELQNILVPEMHTLTTTLNATPTAPSNVDYTVTKAGYYPIGVIGWRAANGSGGGSSYARPFAMYAHTLANGSAKIRAGIGAGGGNVTNCTLYVWVLWAQIID